MSGPQPPSVKQLKVACDVEGLVDALTAGEHAAPAIATWAPTAEAADERKRAFARAESAAARALCELREPSAVEPLIALLDSETLGSLTAAEVLTEIADRRAVEPLIAVLRRAGEPWQLTGVAACALGRFGDSRALEPLIEALEFDSDDEDERFDVRHAAVGALGDLGDPRAVDVLVETLQDGDDDIGRAAFEALGQLGSPHHRVHDTCGGGD